MKILKIFGIVVGIHVFALILIFANPGCSSTTRPAPTPAPTDTVGPTERPPAIIAPTPRSGGIYTAGADTPPPGPVAFNPDAPALSSAPSGGTVRLPPMRPGTPVASVVVAEPVVDVTPATTYAVKSGDSLWSIAKKHHLTIAELTAANGLAANANIKPGQKLKIPGKSASPSHAATAKGAAGPTPKAIDATPAAATPPRPSGDGMKHVVKSGETLSMIAQQYGVRQKDIGAANNISDPAKIKAGTELIIPGWTPTGKSGKAAPKSGAKSGDAKSLPAVEQPAQTPAPPPSVPIIRIDDSPITPAPKQ